MGRPTKLTPELTKRICDKIRKGAFAHVASEACGITRQTFYNWLARGEEARSGLYRKFFDNVRKAIAEARFDCEIRVHPLLPLSWLKCGPARDRGDGEGWTEKSSVELDAQMRGGLATMPSPANVKTLAKMLELAESMGILRPGPRFRELLGRSDDNEDVIDAESIPRLTHDESGDGDDATSQTKAARPGANGNGQAKP